MNKANVLIFAGSVWLAVASNYRIPRARMCNFSSSSLGDSPIPGAQSYLIFSQNLIPRVFRVRAQMLSAIVSMGCLHSVKVAIFPLGIYCKGDDKNALCQKVALLSRLEY